MDDSTGTSTAHRTIASVTALACLINLVVVTLVLLALLERYDAMDERFAGVSVGDDVMLPFVPILLCQAALNGFAFASWKPGRRVGEGILIGTLAATVAALVWWWLALMSSFQ